MAPRADVRAPLVMERLLVRDPALFEQTSAIAELARRLPASWQRLVSAELSNMEAQLIYERFVGVTLRDLSGALRNTGRVLPLEVLRTVIEHLCDGLAGARCEQRAHPGRDRQPRLVDAAARTAAPQARADAPHSMGRVWSASRAPEEGIAVLEDQLLERLEPVDRYPRCGSIEAATHDASPRVPIATGAPRAGLLQRFLALFRR